jgi:hypothetical protein
MTREFNALKWMMCELIADEMTALLDLSDDDVVYWHSWRAGTADMTVVTDPVERKKVVDALLEFHQDVDVDENTPPLTGNKIREMIGGEIIDRDAESWVVPGDEDYWALAPVKMIMDLVK